MKKNLTQTILNGPIITSLLLGVFLIMGGYGVSAAGLHGHGSGGALPNRGFGGQHVLYVPHDGGFPWISLFVALTIGTAIVLCLMKWLKKKEKVTSIEQFIQTTLASPYKPMNSQNEHILDEWEKERNKGEGI